MPSKKAKKVVRKRKRVAFTDEAMRRGYPRLIPYRKNRYGRTLKRAVAGRKIVKFMRKRLGFKPLRAYYMSGAYKTFKY